MFFPKRLSLRKIAPVKPRKRARQRGRRDSAFFPGPAYCGHAVEELEGRQMLAAVTPAVLGTAVPTFVINPNVKPMASPASQPSSQGPYTPVQVATAYGVNAISFDGVVGTGAGQTVAIVDAYNDPNIISDAATFSTQFGLQQFNVAGGPTFRVLNEDGGTTLPQNAPQFGWDVEESLDVEWVHSMAPQANIILFEGNSPNGSDLYTAEATAAGFPGVSVISNSWGGGEYSTETQDDSSYFITPPGHQGVTILASTGDDGTPAGYPSFSPDVVAVGGTNLQIQSSGAYVSESAWSDTGGGTSIYETLPSFQSGINGVNQASTTNRNVPDVSADADPNTGVYVYDSYSYGANGWIDVGGTSLACPLWAGMIAITDQGRVLAGETTLNGATQTLPMLYGLPSSDFNDVTTGSNGTYSAGVGYDLVTGLGTPKANLLVPDLAGYGSQQPPKVTAPTATGTEENNLLTFSTADNNAIDVTDTSAGTNADSLSLAVLHGTLSLATTNGLTFTSGTDNSASFTVSGTVTNLDAALNGLTYQPATNYLGGDTLSVTLLDPGTNQSASKTVPLTVIAPVSQNWTAMSNAVPQGDAGQLSLLLPNGQLFVHGGGGNGPSTSWYLVTPDSTGSYVDGTWTVAGSMNVGRLYFGSTVLPNGEVFVVGGEYATDENFSNSAEIYNPVTNKWTMVASSPKSIVGDEPTELLPDGNVLVGDIEDNGTEIYDPTTNAWSAGGTKVHNDQSDEESWVKLANGDILTYDLFSSITDNKFEAELYNPSTNTWSDASSTVGTIPLLSTEGTGYELGPALLLANGDALFTGTNGTTALYNPGTNSWTQGPTMPSVMINGVMTQLTTGDAPGAILPNGDVVLALSPAVYIDNTGEEQFPGPTYIYDLNTTADVWTNITPSATVDPFLSDSNSFINTFLILPTGQLLLTDDNNQLAVYTPNGSPQASWQPTITSFTQQSGNDYTLTGTQLNGLDEGASYGDDNQMAENYPIVRVVDTSTGTVYYATTSDWSSVGVATGSTPETANVVLPAAIGNDPFTIVVIADGIASNPFSNTAFAPTITAPLAVSVNENGTLVFNGQNAISLADTSGTAEQLVLTVSNGTLNLTTTAGLTVSGAGTKTLTLTGSLTNFNNDLPTLVYTPTTGYLGADTLSLSVKDTTDELINSASVSITITPVAPTFKVPTGVTVNENGSLTLSGGNAISVVDPSGTAEQLVLSVTNGTLTLGTMTGLTVVGNGSTSLTLTGSLSNLNSDLATLTYTPTSGYLGPDVLSLSDTDTGNSLTGTTTVSITVVPVSPTITAPTGGISVAENGSVTFTAGNAITVGDVSGSDEQLTLSVGDGTLDLATTTGLTVTGNNSATVVLTGLLPNLNADLASLTYTPPAGFYGTDTLSLSDQDQADNLSGGTTVSLIVNALAPLVSAPSSAIVGANQSLVFSTGNGNSISVSDVNAGGDALALSVTHGTLSLHTTFGLTFTSGTNGTSSFTVTGSLSNLNMALDGLIYQPTANYFGSDGLSLTITNLADSKSSATSVSLSVKALPTVSGPSTGSTTVNTALTFSSAFGNEISVTDLGASGSDSMTVSAANGTLTLGATTGLTFTSGTNGSNSFTVSGPIGNLNAALDGLSYQPNFSYTGGDTLTVLLRDPGDGLSATSSVALTINAIAAPGISAPITAAVIENGTLTFSTTSSYPITLTDNGAGTSADTEMLSVSSGILTLGSTNGLVFVSGFNGSSSFSVKGTVANFNAAINGLTYQPATGFAGSDTLSISVVDSNDGKSGSASVALTVNALAPTITAPSSASLNENTALPFASSHGNGITVSDANPGTDSLALSVQHGTLTLASTTGLTITAGSNDSASTTVSGTVTNLDAALNGVTYQPISGYTGADTLAITITDSGDNKSASANVSLSIVGLAPPSVTAPATAALAENGSLTFSATNGNVIAVADTGIGANTDSLTLTATHGTLTLASTTGLTFTAGTNGTASFTVAGTLANLNAALNGLIYRPTSGYSGAAAISIGISDSGDNESASTSVALTITAFLPPTITAPSGAVVSENGELVFEPATDNAVSVADSGPGNGSDLLTLTVSHGTVTLASTTGLTVTSGANGSTTITVTGSLVNLNAALNGLVYQPSTGYTGPDTLVVAIKDSSDGQSASANVTLSVTGSTAPAIKAPTAILTRSDAVSFTGTDAVSITDPSAGTGVQQLLIKDSGGTLNLSKTTGLTFVSGANNSMQMVVQGTLANLNAALATLTYTLTGKSQTIGMVYTNLVTGGQGTSSTTVTLFGNTTLGNSPSSNTTTGPATSSIPPDSEV